MQAIFSTRLQMLWLQWLVGEKKKKPQSKPCEIPVPISSLRRLRNRRSLVFSGVVQIKYQEYQIQFPRCQGALWSGVTITFPGQDDQSTWYTSYNFHPAKTFNKAFRKAFSWQTIMRRDVWPCQVVIWGKSWKPGHPFSMFTLKRGMTSTLLTQRKCLNATLRWN